MDNLLFPCAMMLWIAGILFYCVLFPIATQKCFWGKASIQKTICNVIGCILLMPMLVYEYSAALSMFLLEGFHIASASVEGTIISTFCELAFIVLAVYLYIRYFKPANKIIAIFVYLMVYVITLIPSSLPPMTATSEETLQIFGESLLIIALGYVFYRFLIVPVSKITHVDIKTGRRAYIVLPAFSLAYTLIIEKINSRYEENHLLLGVTAISSVFVILAVCIGFHYIIRNTIAIGELEKARDDVKTLSVEVMDAMTSNRSYRNYLPQEVVREELEKNIGTQFDPEVAKCMIALIDEDNLSKIV